LQDYDQQIQKLERLQHLYSKVVDSAATAGDFSAG
jgi:hypothetical protein